MEVSNRCGVWVWRVGRGEEGRFLQQQAREAKPGQCG